MQMKSIYSIMFIAVAATARLQTMSAENVDNNPSEVLIQQLKESVSDNWDKLSKWCRQTLNLHVDLEDPDLPESSWIFASKEKKKVKLTIS